MSNIKCYTVKVETPYVVQQYVETTWAKLPEEKYKDRIKDQWEEFGRVHNVPIKISVKKTPCSKISKIKRYIKKK